MPDGELKDEQLWDMFMRSSPDGTPDLLASESQDSTSDSSDSPRSAYPFSPDLNGLPNPFFDPKLQALGYRYPVDSDIGICTGPISRVSLSQYATESSFTASPSSEFTHSDAAMRT